MVSTTARNRNLCMKLSKHHFSMYEFGIRASYSLEPLHHWREKWRKYSAMFDIIRGGYISTEILYLYFLEIK